MEITEKVLNEHIDKIINRRVQERNKRVVWKTQSN